MSQPNVLIICTDHWGARLTGPEGHPTVMTPTLNQLARCGTWFSRAYSACPTCIPARRTLMTGLSARSHGDREFKEHEPMPEAPTMAQCFRDAGYQAYAVGKLHVYPQRDRIGFDEVILNEEGRHHLGMRADDWEQYLAEQGYPGYEYASGVCNNDYEVVPWQLPTALHPTNWAAREMCRTIHRRDPNRPALWYLSFAAPHPPLMPLPCYLDQYRDVPVDEPVYGDWSRDAADMPWFLRFRAARGTGIEMALPHERDLALRAFYATLTHIDHQIRVVIGTLREAGILEDTAIMFTADHGDMLGDHHQWDKSIMLDGSARVPLLLVPPTNDPRYRGGVRDDRIAELRDIMPTALELAGIPVPAGVEGLSLLGEQRRDYLYGEHFVGERATRMIREDRYKLVYYAVGNSFQLFDLDADPRECHDLAEDPAHAETRARLTATLVGELYGSDREWLDGDTLVGLPDTGVLPTPRPGLGGQRGYRFM